MLNKLKYNTLITTTLFCTQYFLSTFHNFSSFYFLLLLRLLIVVFKHHKKIVLFVEVQGMLSNDYFCIKYVSCNLYKSLLFLCKDCLMGPDSLKASVDKFSFLY